MKNKSLIIIFVLFITVTFVAYLFFDSNNIKNYPSAGTDIIAYGDSLVEGVGSTPDHNFVSVLSQKIDRPIINLGHSGDTTKDGLNRIGELDKYNPKVVLLLLGGNDYLKKVPKEETVANLSAIIENIQSKGAVVLLLGVRGGLVSDPFDKEFKKLSSNYGAAFVRDVLDGLIGRGEYMSDAVHPNDAGYKIISDRIYPVLIKLIK